MERERLIDDRIYSSMAAEDAHFSSQQKPISAFAHVCYSAKKLLGFGEKNLKCGDPKMEYSAIPNQTSGLGTRSPPPLNSVPAPSDPDRTAEKWEKRLINSALSDQHQMAGELLHKKGLHEELHQQLDLREEAEKKKREAAAAEKRSNDRSEEEELKSGGEENGNGTKMQQYPLRPDAEDCAFYMKTGTCKFGSNCRFNHPLIRKNQPAKEKVKEREEGVEVPGQTECKYYLRTGGCKYGDACRYNHSKAKTPVIPVAELNFLGLPIRPGEKECPYYMRNGSCKYEASCRFNHPDPTVAGGIESPAFVNGVSVSLKSPSQSSISSWSSPRTLNETAPPVPIMFPPTQGVPAHNTEWNGYQAPVYPPERSIHPPPAYVISNLTSETNVFEHQQHQMLVDEFPERPGQPECSFYMKTGDCKFKSNCKFHHPKDRRLKSPPCALSDTGLPLRPDQNLCSYYSRYGICKFGPACKFDHPVQLPPPVGSNLNQPSPFGNSATTEQSRMAEAGNGNDTAVQQRA